jgi:hypothetical protein
LPIFDWDGIKKSSEGQDVWKEGLMIVEVVKDVTFRNLREAGREESFGGDWRVRG